MLNSVIIDVNNIINNKYEYDYVSQITKLYIIENYIIHKCINIRGRTEMIIIPTDYKKITGIHLCNQNNLCYDCVDIYDFLILNSITHIECINLHFCDQIMTFNEKINKFVKLKYICFEKLFNQQINYPNELFYIKYGDVFNQPIYNLPSKLQILIFGHNFNQSVDYLPSKLEILIFGFSFNQSVDNLPCSIKFIHFGNNFNQNVDFLPESLLILHLGNMFNQPIDNLPISLVELFFWTNEFISNQKKEFKINELINININEILNKSNKNDIQMKYLFYSILELNNGNLFSHPIDNLPNNIKYLYLHPTYNNNINKLPTNLIVLSLGFQAFYPIEKLNILPNLQLVVIGLVTYSDKNYIKKFTNTCNDNLYVVLKYVDTISKPCHFQIIIKEKKYYFSKIIKYPLKIYWSFNCLFS